MKCTQGTKQFPDSLLFEVCALDADTMYVGTQVKEVLFWLLCGGLQDIAQFGKLLMKRRDGLMVGEELHGIHPLMPQGAEAVAVQHRTYLVETYLFFESHHFRFFSGYIVFHHVGSSCSQRANQAMMLSCQRMRLS